MTHTHAPGVSAIRTIAIAALVALALSGCEETKRALGYDKAPPDEFQVVHRAPLAVPPEFGLRPPSPGAVRPQEGLTREQARNTLMGVRPTQPISTVGRDQSDVALLKRAGADQIQPNIREMVNKETQALADTGKTFTDRLVFWRKADSLGTGEQLDAERESQRLRENQALGRAVTEGETPKIERKRRGLLEGLL